MRPLLIAAIALAVSVPPAIEQTQARPPIFRSTVDRVTVTTIVRDREGRPVTTLTRDDFELFDGGLARPIADFRSEQAAISIALLVDFSGSMGLADRRVAAREAANQIMSGLTPEDQVGLFVFDKQLRELAPFGSSRAQILSALESVRPFGMTSLFDAIAETGRVVARRGGTHRAVVTLTDGDDNASQLTAARVSAIASGVDVPVYLCLLSPPEDDRPGVAASDEAWMDPAARGRLADLAKWTGGHSFVTSSSADSSAAARQIISELRHQYVIAFEPNHRPGWHAIDIRTRRKHLIVQARSGYVVDGRPENEQDPRRR